MRVCPQRAGAFVVYGHAWATSASGTPDAELTADKVKHFLL